MSHKYKWMKQIQLGKRQIRVTTKCEADIDTKNKTVSIKVAGDKINLTMKELDLIQHEVYKKVKEDAQYVKK